MSYVLEQTLNRFEALLANDTKETVDKRHKKGEFSYIPLSMEEFTRQITVVEGLLDSGHDRTFIDVGCGIGTKMIAANILLHCRVFGIEKDPKYVEAARKLLGTDGNYRFGSIPGTVIHSDALEHSYEPYDVIYFYCPLFDDKLQVKLEQRIITTAKKGAFVMANLKKDYKAWDSNPKVRRVWKDKIYQKL